MWLHLPGPCPSPLAHRRTQPLKNASLPAQPSGQRLREHPGRDTRNVTGGQAPAHATTGHVAFHLLTCWSATKAPRTRSLHRNCVMGLTYQDDRFNSASKKTSWPRWGFSCSFFIYLFLAMLGLCFCVSFLSLRWSGATKFWCAGVFSFPWFLLLGSMSSRA